MVSFLRIFDGAHQLVCQSVATVNTYRSVNRAWARQRDVIACIGMQGPGTALTMITALPMIFDSLSRIGFSVACCVKDHNDIPSREKTDP